MSKKLNLKEKAIALKNQILTLYLAQQHPRTPWYAKAFTLFLFLFVFSPIDLIPDFIPILGLLDDLILVPLGIFIAIQLIPPDILEESRQQAQTTTLKNIPKKWLGAAIIISLWLIILFILIQKILPLFD